jgi:hypothetical protein
MRIALCAGILVSIVACAKQSQPGMAPPPPQPQSPAQNATGSHPQAAGTAPITDEQGETFQITQGVPGDPAIVGCADGQREAFVDAAKFPKVAGCIGEWPDLANLRAAPTGGTCGDDLGPCAVPADACASGWHVCGASGQIAEVAAIGGPECEQAGGGKFVAAISHCATQSGCNYADASTGSYQCFEKGWCSEAVCCGTGCGVGVCPSGVWVDQTRIAKGTDQGCGAMRASRARGILCCK